MYYLIRRTSFLAHYGVKGMRWGVRRYQDYNGRRIGTNAAKQRAHDDAVKRMNKVGDYYDGFYSKDVKASNARHPIEKLSDIERYAPGTNISKLREQVNHVEDGAGGGRDYNCPNCAAAFEMIERGYSVTARKKPYGSNVEDIEAFFKDGKLQSCEGGESVFERYGIKRLRDKYLAAEAEMRKKDDELYDSIKNLSEVETNPALRERVRLQAAKNRAPFKKAREAYYGELNKACDEVKDRTLAELKAQGEGARGVMAVGWYTNDGGRATQYHAFNYKVEHGEVKFYDAQSNHEEKRNGGVSHQFFRDADPRDVYYMRTDNLEPSEKITSAVYSNKRKGA